MANVMQVLPELEGDEQLFVQGILKDLDDAKAQQFALSYRARRRDPQIILLTTLVGLIGIAGIQRFLIDQIGMGVVYLLTGGLCAVGTIVDAINYKKLAFEYNSKQAQQIIAMLRSAM
ncbi:MAG TPA: TM2 domain-containing protein [Anaerolineae bacterium]|nr:TM2 domain-containing protein [Anaerolineae bacterium]